MRNPYITALWVFTILVIVVGVIYLGTGTSANSANQGSGTASLATGGVLFSVGLVGLFTTLLASAVRWQPEP